MWFVNTEHNWKLSISEPKKPSTEFFKEFGTVGFASDDLSYIQSLVKQISNGEHDWEQLKVELASLNLTKQPTPKFDKKLSRACENLQVFDYFNSKHNAAIFSQVTSLKQNWDNLKNIELARLESILNSLLGGIESHLNQLLGKEGPDYLLAIQNCFDVSYSSNIFF